MRRVASGGHLNLPTTSITLLAYKEQGRGETLAPMGPEE